jgi:uroporphyrinogen-III synthase
VRKALEGGEYDASVLASAGLQRLDMVDVISEWLPLDVMLPAPGQGALGVQCRAGDEATLAFLGAINDESVRAATRAERRFLQALGGGCSAPIAAYATPRDQDGSLHLRGLIASPDGRQVIRVDGSGNDPVELGDRLAAEAKAQGAEAILEGVELNRPVQLTEAPKPLAGKRVVVTRPAHQAPELAKPLKALGATPILFPTISIRAMEDTGPLDEAIGRLLEGGYDWVIFTSVNGVAAFWERLDALGQDALIFERVKVAAIGPATGDALTAKGIKADFIPEEFVAEAIAEGLDDMSGRSILLPRAAIARKTLAHMLVRQGAKVDEVASYQTLPAQPGVDALDALKEADVFTFTSSSTVSNFVELTGGPRAAVELTRGAFIACIGPITAGTVEEFGMVPHIVAEDYTIDGLVAALVDAA